ncbi:hypothetical protein DPMN_071847 [Dreissena polymorpha]|uniref:Uncharacterized protein n=1 Tax=Dreissena polymorpha TaxID=45954 RepID=A0A9D3Z3N1_DREPO|nr:hypothetical protein DPMN_071847 [Dreissena polymorpha]
MLAKETRLALNSSRQNFVASSCVCSFVITKNSFNPIGTHWDVRGKGFVWVVLDKGFVVAISVGNTKHLHFTLDGNTKQFHNQDASLTM